MYKGIQKKLLLSFVGVALVSLLTIILLLNFAMSYSFTTYLDNQRQVDAKAIQKELVTAYDPSTKWSKDQLMNISHFALLRDVQIRIMNDAKQVIWDSANMDMIQPKGGQQAPEQNRPIELPLQKDQIRIGTLQVLPVNTVLHDQEQQFLSLLNNLIWVALVFVLAGVYLFSQYISKTISRPLIRIREAAVKMRDGDLEQRVSVDNQTDEVSEVGLALNRLADSLQRQERLRKNLTADIAHELRTPLATIRSHIEAFQDGIWEPTGVKLQICHDQVLQLVRLIKDLENLADVENPMLKLDKKVLNLQKVLQEAVQSVSGLWVDKQIQLSMQVDPDIYVFGDNYRLLQVFINLISNAYKYNRQNGSVAIHTEVEPEAVLIRFQDTGLGIPPEEQPFVFERFYRGDKSRNRKTGGAGIGLAVVKAIVEAHDGSVSVASEPGIGSEFTVRLPN